MSDTRYKKTLTLQGAKKIAARAAEKARELAVGGVVAVVDEGGNLIYCERWEGTMPAAATITIGKAATAAAFNRPTKILEALIKDQRPAMLDLTGITHTPYVPLMGAYPLKIDGQTIGAVAVGGAETGDNDEIIAQYAAATPLESAS